MQNRTMFSCRQHLFSLVELMVAMGVLVVMMGFLFQFVIGAQRIWSASNRNASAFTDAQLVFNLLERDLHNAIFQYSEEFPARGIPMFLEKNGTNLEKLFLVSATAAPASGNDIAEKVGYYPIIYSLALDPQPPVTQKFPPGYPPRILCRDVLDQDFSSPDYKSFAYFGSDKPQLPDDDWQSDPSRREILCRNIRELNLSALPAPDGSGKFLNQPRAFKASLTLYESVIGAAETDEPRQRIFSKIIFLR